MKKHFLLGLLLLTSCAGTGATPHMAEQLSDHGQYRADLAICQSWAAPTHHEWAERCAAQGDMILISSLIDNLSADDPRDHDGRRQSLPNTTQARLDACLKDKGYAVDTSGDIKKLASR